MTPADQNPPRPRAPLLREIGDASPHAPGPHPTPAEAPPITDTPRPRAMQTAVRLAAARPSRLTRFFIQSGLALFTFLLGVAALNYINTLLLRVPVLGWIALVLFSAFTLAALAMGGREYLAFARLRRIDGISRQASTALADNNLPLARQTLHEITALYAGREGAEMARERLTAREGEHFDAAPLLAEAETLLLAPLDQAAQREIEAAARSVAAVTALVPLALADVATAFAANLRMIRRIAEIYGGRAGAIGGWRLARTVMTHLVATGAVAAGDDLIETVAGGGLLSKLSRRFGEGVVNGALTARVGVAAMEVCRPLPFITQPRPRVTGLVRRAVTGLFDRADPPRDQPAQDSSDPKAAAQS